MSGTELDRQVAAIHGRLATETEKSLRFDGRLYAASSPEGLPGLLTGLLYDHVYAGLPSGPRPELPLADAGFLHALHTAVAAPSRASARDQAGFFYVHGAQLSEASASEDLLRIYFHLRPAAVLRLVATLPARLERFEIPFRLKTLSQPVRLAERRDGTVLFFAARHFAITAHLCLEAWASLAEELKPAGIPLFTHELAPGMGLAEDPGTSFGLSRCRLLAAGWLEAGACRPASLAASIDATRRVFLAAGLDPERPYLNPGSVGFFPRLATTEGPL